MITELLLTFIYTIIQVIISPIILLPDVSMSSSLATSIHTASGYIASFNNFLPLTTMLSILGIYLVIEGAVLTYRLIMWVIKKIPTVN